MTDEESHRAFGFPPEQAGVRGAPACYWVLTLDPSEKRLHFLCGQRRSLPHLFEFDLESRTLLGSVAIEAVTGRIKVDVALNLMVLPLARGGPQVRDLKGAHLAVLEGAPEFIDAAIMPDGSVLLAEHIGAIWRWDWRTGSLTRFIEEASVPGCVGDVIAFMRGSTELWLRVPGAEPMLMVRLTGAPEAEARRWVHAPWVSPDGRFVLAHLTLDAKAQIRAAVAVDRATGRVQRMAQAHPNASFAWL